MDDLWFYIKLKLKFLDHIFGCFIFIEIDPIMASSLLDDETDSDQDKESLLSPGKILSLSPEKESFHSPGKIISLDQIKLPYVLILDLYITGNA